MITEKKNSITDPLPADVTALQALVRELQSELKISTLRCARLEYKMRDLIRRMYGPKSEKLNPAQRLLFGILDETPIEALATGFAPPSDTYTIGYRLVLPSCSLRIFISRLGERISSLSQHLVLHPVPEFMDKEEAIKHVLEK
jgi:hypothetical protein